MIYRHSITGNASCDIIPAEIDYSGEKLMNKRPESRGHESVGASDRYAWTLETGPKKQ